VPSQKTFLSIFVLWIFKTLIWLHEARMCFGCAPKEVMKLEIRSDDGTRKRYRGIRSAGRMLQILYYEPWHPMRKVPPR
jgi:hypothetical protein